MEWKQTIVNQLRERKRQERDIYAEIIKHYSIIIFRCTDQEREILTLRQENADLRNNRVIPPDPIIGDDKYKTLENAYIRVKDEVLTLFREKEEKAKEVTRLKGIMREEEEKLYSEDNKNQILTKENTSLKQRLESTEEKLNALRRENERIRDDHQVSQILYTQLEERKLELDAIIAVLLEKVTEKIEKKCDVLNKEVEEHKKRVDDGLKQKLDEATNDVTILSSASTAPTIMENINPDERITQTPTFDFIKAIVPTKAIIKWDCGDNEIHAVQFHPSDSIIATGGSDRKIHVWKINNHTNQVQQSYVLTGNNSTVTAIDFDNEGANLILGCSEDFACRVWGLDDQRLRHTLSGHGAKVSCAKFITTSLIASGSHDCTLKLWDLQNRQCIRTISAGSKCQDLVAYDASGSLISGHLDSKIRFWDSRNGSIKCELQLQEAITSLAINREKQILLACSKDNTLKLIELRENRVIQTFSHVDFKVASDTVKAVLSPDGAYTCAGGSDGSLFVWNTTNGTIEKVLSKEHLSIINAVAWHPNGQFIVSCEKQRQAILWGE